MTDPEEEIILTSDDKAAKLVTITGWVSRNGHFYGNNESIARSDGATHYVCSSCNKPSPKPYTKCNSCRAKSSRETYFKLPLVEWDYKNPLVLWGDDKYFFDADDIEEYLEEQELKAEDLMLTLCEGNRLHEIELDYWSDDWPEDGEPPEEFCKRLAEINKYIASMPPVSWSKGKKRVNYEVDKGEEPQHA